MEKIMANVRTCPQCEYTTNIVGDLTQHRKSVHGLPRMFNTGGGYVHMTSEGWRLRGTVTGRVTLTRPNTQEVDKSRGE